MSRIENSPCDPKLLSPLALAFVGDGVYDLFVRERLVCEANRPVKKLNEEKVSIVRCSSHRDRCCDASRFERTHAEEHQLPVRCMP